jgi:hydrocephalus-inducing protein
MESSVRQSARHLITVENPLQYGPPITMGVPNNPNDWWSCDSKSIRVKQLVPISGNSEGSFEVEYRPLIPTKQPQEHLLTIMTKELGTFKYKVIVTATPSSVRQTLHFEVPLGSVQTESFIFKAYNNVQTTFASTVRQPNFFSVNKSLALPPVTEWDGVDARLPITFEPADIGVQHDVLTLTSPEGGLYECELVGRCVPPMPLGPYNFVQGLSMDIPFRNCFNESCQWSFIVDSPHFTLATATATVVAKTDSVCTVVYQYVADDASAASAMATDGVTAKLFIRCISKPSVPPWIVYLRGKV